jgi:LmbE family N-acetylglucosaminyl deacetylase
LGCSRVELLGYLDSGLNAATAAPAPAGVTLAGASAISGSTPSDSTGDDGTDGGGTDGGGTDGGGDAARAGPAGDIAAGAGTTGAAMRFVDAPVEEAAERLAAVLRDEQADLLISYDSRGGYGHPDHVQVHRVGARAAALVGVPVVLEATIDRNALRPVLRLLRVAGRLLPRLPLGGLGTVFTPRREITHVVDVRPYLTQKRAALAAHASQTEGGGLRTVGVLLRLPDAVFARVAGREWFVQPGRVPGPSRDDIFADLR